MHDNVWQNIFIIEIWKVWNNFLLWNSFCKTFGNSFKVKQNQMMIIDQIWHLDCRDRKAARDATIHFNSIHTESWISNIAVITSQCLVGWLTTAEKSVNNERIKESFKLKINPQLYLPTFSRFIDLNLTSFSFTSILVSSSNSTTGIYKEPILK